MTKELSKAITKDSITSNEFFWKTVKPFLIRKGKILHNFIRNETRDDLVRDEKQLFNETL